MIYRLRDVRPRASIITASKTATSSHDSGRKLDFGLTRASLITKAWYGSARRCPGNTSKDPPRRFIVYSRCHLNDYSPCEHSTCPTTDRPRSLSPRGSDVVAKPMCKMQTKEQGNTGKAELFCNIASSQTVSYSTSQCIVIPDASEAHEIFGHLGIISLASS